MIWSRRPRRSHGAQASGSLTYKTLARELVDDPAQARARIASGAADHLDGASLVRLMLQQLPGASQPQDQALGLIDVIIASRVGKQIIPADTADELQAIAQELERYGFYEGAGRP